MVVVKVLAPLVLVVLLVIFTVLATTCLALDQSRQDNNQTQANNTTLAPQTNTTMSPQTNAPNQHNATTPKAPPPSQPPGDEKYKDVTDFVMGMNWWDFSGVWGKLNLTKLNQFLFKIPQIPEAPDQAVLVCMSPAMPCMLQKTFQGLTSATFSFTFFVSSPDGLLKMRGEVIEAGSKTIISSRFPSNNNTNTNSGNNNNNNSNSSSIRKEFFFTYSFPDDLLEQNHTWVTLNLTLPNLTSAGNFKVRLSVDLGNNGVWAVGGVNVSGVPLPPAPTPSPAPPPPVTAPSLNHTTQAPPTNTTTPQPAVNATTPSVNATTPSVNATTPSVNATSPVINTTEPSVNATNPPVITNKPSLNATTPSSNATSAPGGGNSTLNPGVQANVTKVPPSASASTLTQLPTQSGQAGGEVGKLRGVAQAIWDAFYVFLALFIACLLALVALIIHGRCKNDEPPPTVATYNPRTSSYRLDKVYDNPSYENNAA